MIIDRMTRTLDRTRWAIALPTLIAASALAGAACAYELKQPTVACGSARVSGGSFTLSGTIAEAGPVGSASNASRALGLGYWHPVFSLIATDVPPGPGFNAGLANALGRGIPNPFTTSTAIAFSVAERSDVLLEIFDVSGRRVTTLARGPYAPGRYSLDWLGLDSAGRSVASGVYVSRLTVGPWAQSQRLLKLR